MRHTGKLSNENNGICRTLTPVNLGSNPSPPAKSQFLPISSSHWPRSASRLPWFPPTDQTVGGSWRPLGRPPRCSSRVRSSADGVFRAVLAVRTAFGHSARVREADALLHVGLVGALVPFDLPQAAVLLIAPLGRHFLEEGGVDDAVELVDIHGVDPLL